MPPDYIATAAAAMALALNDYAADLYGQAEDASFEPLEFAALGASLARTGADATKGRALIEQAAGDAKKLNEFLTIAGYAKEALGDEALAAGLIAKVEAQAKTLPDFIDLAGKLKAEGAVDAAAALYAKAARHCDDLPATVAYAQGHVAIFGNQAATKKVLDDAETDSQFPKDFAALAGGYKTLLNDDAKVADLMEQAAGFAMSGEEYLDLARGYWTLLQDAAAATAALKKALPNVNDKGQLLELAAFIAREIKDADLAKGFYAKAEARMTAAPERLKLAEAVLADTGDKALAADIYGRAAAALTQPNDLMSVAANVVDRLDAPATATAIYRKAFAAMSDLGQYLKLLEAVDSKLGDKAFAGEEVLTAAAAVAGGSVDRLEVARRMLAVLGERATARPVLIAAEEQVTSVGEMKQVVAMIREHYADDADWVATAADKLARRLRGVPGAREEGQQQHRGHASGRCGDRRTR